MPISIKDYEILNARVSFERSLYDAPAVEGAKYLKDPNRFGGPTSTISKPPPVFPTKVNLTDAYSRFEGGLNSPRSIPGGIPNGSIAGAKPSIGSLPKSPLQTALEQPLKLPSLPKSLGNLPKPSGIVANAGAIKSILATGAKGIIPALVQKAIEDDIAKMTAPGAGAKRKKDFEDAVANSPFNRLLPPWLNPSKQQRGQFDPKNPGESYKFSHPVGVRFYSPNNQIIVEWVVSSYGVGTTQDGPEIHYIGVDGYHSPIPGPSVLLSSIELFQVPGQPPPNPLAPLEISRPPEASSPVPDFVPVSSIKPFSPTLAAPAPAALPSKEANPERYPTIAPSSPGVPVPAPNRPKDEEKKPAPLIPPIPFIPILPAKAPSSPSTMPGWKSLTDPTQSPAANPGTGMSGAKPPTVPPVASPPRCRDKCSQAIQDKVDGLGDRLQKGVPIVNAAGQAVDLELLTTINSKLGEQLPGGIGGKLTRLSEWLHLDRVLNVLTFTSTLHNAYFLSNGLTQTLFSMISNVLAVVGIKDNEGNPLNISNIVGSTVENFAKGVLGVETVDGIKAEWKKYSRIYQAAANIVWSVQSIGQSILSVLEVVGSNVAKIGNALKRFGVIGELAFGWMNQTPNFQNRFFTAFETAQNVTSQIDGVTSNVLSGQQTFDQLFQQKDELEKAMKEDEGSKQGKESPEAAKKKQAETQSKTVSTTTTIPVEAETKPTP